MLKFKYVKFRKMLVSFVYQLTEDVIIDLSEYAKCPHIKNTKSTFVEIQDNILLIKKGFAWDGPSGPTIDTKPFLAASLVHDALYRLISIGALERTPCSQLWADKMLLKVGIVCGMWEIRAKLAYYAVRIFGHKSTLPRKEYST